MPDTPLSLLERLRENGEDRAWRNLFEFFSPLIETWVRREGVPGADADDLVQEILLVVVEEFGRFEHNGRVGAFRAWLRAITANRTLGYWRSRQARPETLANLSALEDPSSDLSRAWDREHDEYVMARALSALEPQFSPATWRAFREQVVEGKPAAEVAAGLGTSVNAVLIAKSRVLRRLRMELKGLIDGDAEFGEDSPA